MAGNGKTGVPNAPKGGRGVWAGAVARRLGQVRLRTTRAALLREIVRTVDDLDRLAAVTAREGLTVGVKVHPALVEARQLRIALARLVGALRLPAGEEDDQAAGRRPQRRVGARGIYMVGGA